MPTVNQNSIVVINKYAFTQSPHGIVQLYIIYHF